jgi:hypothetical protein
VRNTGRNMYARTFLGVKKFLPHLKISAAFEHIKCLERLNVIMRTRLKSGLTVLLYDLEALICVAACNLDDDLVSLGVDVAGAGRRMLALACFG